MKEAERIITQINSALNGIVWGPLMIAFILAVGVMFTVRTNFFQITKFSLWIRKTFFAIFTRKSVRKGNEKGSISQFQSLATALAGTLGTGSVAGVATAIVMGGAGAVFWMWVSAFFGMMTSFAENVLGIKYRCKNANGEWVGGAMIYLERGLHCKPLAAAFSFFCILASFGIGNMTQANSISGALEASFGISPAVTGIALAVLVTAVIIGGISRIGCVAEKIIPFIAIAYLLGCVYVIIINYERLPKALCDIFSSAFGLKQAGGGIAGYTMMRAVRSGVARGVFSNEAGLGSSVTVHSAADVKEPVQQGMWGVFEVFTDTIVVCTLTALVLLTSGVCENNFNPLTGKAILDGVPLTAAAFSCGLGRFGGCFVSVSIVLFAFATILGWSYYGERSTAYIFGDRAIPVYKVIFSFMTVVGCVSELELVWSISDTFNGLMALPNLIGLVLLSDVVVREKKDYLKKRKNLIEREKS